LRIIGLSQKNCGYSQKTPRHLVFQAGYGPGMFAIT